MADNGDSEPASNTGDIDERIDNIARVVKDYLRVGEAFLVRSEEGEIVVEEAPHTNLEKEHPRLYGRLLSINDQLDTGCGLMAVLLAVGAVFCLGLHAGWWDALIPPNITDYLKSWWFYSIFLVALFFVGNWLHDYWAKLIYRKVRADLFAVLRDEGFDRDTLVLEIKGMPEFNNVGIQLKLDRGPFSME